jgi:putative phosphoesterase
VIAVISDTHMPKGARRLPDACLKRIRAAELLLHAGDVTTAAAFREMEKLGPPVAAVHGNVDDSVLRHSLPKERVEEIEGVRIAMVHDAGPSRQRLGRLRASFPDADAVVFGHSHLPLHEEEGGFQIFNPGSPTERRRAPVRTMGVARVHDGRVEFELIALD